MAIYRTEVLEALGQGAAQVVDVSSNVSPGTTDMTAFIQAQLTASTAGKICVLPGGIFKTTSTLVMPAGSRLVGDPRSTYDEYGSGSVIYFRPSANTVAIRNAASAADILVQDIGIDSASYSHSGFSFDVTSSVTMRNIGFHGNFDIGVHVGAGDVLEMDELTFFECGIKRAAIYIGGGNAITVRKLHTSGLAIETAGTDTAYGIAVGGVSAARSVTISDCIFQGLTIGIGLCRVNAVNIDNPYFEETLCNVRTGDPTISIDSRSIVFNGGSYTATSTHAQHASRGPLIYLVRARTATFNTPNFLNSVEDDAILQPIFCDVTTNNVVVINPYFYDSAVPGAGAPLRTNLFMQSTGSPSPSITGIGIPYGTNGAHELILKKDGAYGGTSYGLRIDTSGTVSTTAFTPPTYAAPNALLTAAMPSLATI